MQYDTTVQLSRALLAYAAKKDTTLSQTSTLLESKKFRDAAFDKIFPIIFSIHGLDIEEALSKAVAAKEITPNAADYAKEGIYLAMSQLSAKYPVLSSGDIREVEAKFLEFVNIFNEGGSDTLYKDKYNRMTKPLDEVKIIFSTPRVVQYIQGTPKKVPSLKIASNSFKNLRQTVNRSIKENIKSLLIENKVTNSKLLDENYLTTKIINWGHTQAVVDDKTVFLSGKLVAEFLSLSPITQGIKDRNKLNNLYSVFVQDFIEVTGQETTSIKLTRGAITKGDSGVLELAINSGLFQLVRVQSKTENQGDLATAERKWSIAEATGKLGLLKQKIFGDDVTSIQGLVSRLLKIRSSPNVLEDISTSLSNTLSGIKGSVGQAKTINLLNHKRQIKKKRVKVKLKQNNTENLRLGAGRDSQSLLNLERLQSLINSNLHDQIQSNMGTGSRQDVLNYQTGRFARSAKIERLSESRKGMITAFYSYMKNPYATFSSGGRQEFPTTRDPKLLISKSIRELAGSLVANRMRAVLV